MGEAWHEIVTVVGTPGREDLAFEINFILPDCSQIHSPTPRQIDAVSMFYQRSFDDLTEEQAHVLLGCREYARLCADLLFKAYGVESRRLLSICLAAFLLADSERCSFSTIWSEQNFARGSRSPRVKGTPIFLEMEAFASYLDGCIKMNGWTPANLP